MTGLTHTLLVNLKNVRDRIDDEVMALTAALMPVGTTRGWAHTIMGGPDPPPVRGLTVEAFFDATSSRYLDFVDAALEILRSAYDDDPQRYGYLGWISLRFHGRSRAYLAPQHASNRSVAVEFAVAWRMHDVPGTEWPDTPLLLGRIEEAARRFGGIQHWGLSNGLKREDVVRAYPRLDTWRRVRWELAKGGTLTTFDSDFTRRCGLSDAPLLAPVADFDNDGRSDLAVWRPSTGTWWVIDSSTGGARTQQRGQAGDVPVPADYDGDGRTDFAIWRPSTGTWWVIDSSTGARRSRQWGQLSDVPVPSRYTGRAAADFAIWRPGTGTWWVMDGSTGAQHSRQWGDPGDIPVPGTYDDDKRTGFAVWRPRTGMWLIAGAGGGRSQQWGQPGDIPVPGRFDHDGRTDFAVWRPSTGEWWTMDSATGAQRGVQWGQVGDLPV